MEQNNNHNRPTLGVVAICYNEERDMESFIHHLLTWVDEIVLIDDGSTDGSAEIALRGGPKVSFIVSPRKDGEFFSHQRNKGIDASKSDWLLHMDIDERVTPGLAKEILKAIQNKKYDAYRFRRLNFFLHRPMIAGGWQDWNQPHLARRDKLRFGGMYHEDHMLKTHPARVGQLREKMWHLNDESYKERMKKSFLYCQEQAFQIVEKGITIQWWSLLFWPALEFFRKFIKKRGYRDGILGLLFAIHSMCAMFRACALAWDEQNRISRTDIERKLQAEWADASKR